MNPEVHVSALTCTVDSNDLKIRSRHPDARLWLLALPLQKVTPEVGSAGCGDRDDRIFLIDDPIEVVVVDNLYVSWCDNN